MTRWNVIPLTIALLVLLLAPAAAQPDPVLDASLVNFRVDALDGEYLEMDVASRYGTLGLLIEDFSKPSDAGAAAGQPIRYTVRVEPVMEDGAWNVIVQPGQFSLQPGGSRQLAVEFSTTGQGEAYHQVKINVTATPVICCSARSQTVNLIAHMEGAQVLTARVLDGLGVQTVKPDQTILFPLEMTNLGLEVKGYQFRTTSNPCNLAVTYSTIYLAPRVPTQTVIGAQAPGDKFWYFSESCSLNIVAQGIDGGGSKSIPLTIKVDGGYFDPQWAINFLYLAVPVLILILFLAGRKRKVEEEILGKPQPPWTMPAEQIYLAELEKKDPRAAYVVRNFLMEDEYQSALDWYHSYKRATRGERAKERIVLAQEHKVERWDARQARKLAKPEKKADKFALRLQNKLNRKDRKAHRKATRKWRKACKKLDAKNAKVYEKLHGVWQRQQKKALKKGTPVPTEPQLDTPDYPDEPTMVERDLADHKWAGKALAFQERMAKRTDRMQASSSRARDRKLRKVRRKVNRVARKLDNPNFMDEHPLLKPSDAQ